MQWLHKKEGFEEINKLSRARTPFLFISSFDGEKIFGPNETRAFNVMLGLNIILGAHGYKDSPKIDAYSEF